MTMVRPLRLLLLIGALFLIVPHLWSISRIRLEPMPANPSMPSFADIGPETGLDYDASKGYRDRVERDFERLKEECNSASLIEFGHTVAWFYINAVGEAHRAGVARIEEAPGWSPDDQRVDNYVAALANAGILKTEHLPSNAGRAEGRIPLSVEGAVPQNYPDWAEPPLTLRCKTTQ